MMKYLKASIMIAAVFAFFTGAPYAHANETIQWGTTRTDADPVGNTTTFQKFAQKFTASGTFDTASTSICVANNGSPTDNFRVSVEVDVAGLPSNIELANSELPASTFGTTVVPCAGLYHFPNITGLTGLAATYWLVFSRTGSLSDTDLFYVSLADGGSASIAAYDGVVWRTTTLGTSKNWITGLLDLSTTAAPAVPKLPPFLMQWTTWW